MPKRYFMEGDDASSGLFLYFLSFAILQYDTRYRCQYPIAGGIKSKTFSTIVVGILMTAAVELVCRCLEYV